MWFKQYKDYPIDTSLIHERVEPGKGIVGCEMHEPNGWGESYTLPKRKKGGLIRKLLNSLFGSYG